MTIQAYYKDKIVLNSKKNIANYMDKFQNKKLIIVYEETTYLKYSELLHFDTLNIVQQVNIQFFDVNLVEPGTILFLVEDFYAFPKVYKALHNYNMYKNDICYDLLLDLDIVHPMRFELLWGNIVRLSKLLSLEDESYVITQNCNSYQVLLKTLLFQTQLVRSDYIAALIYPEQYRDIFGTLDTTLNDVIVFCDGSTKKSNFFYGINYLRFFTFVNLFIGTSSYTLPVSSKYINIKHGILNQPSPLLFSLNQIEQDELSFFTKRCRKKADINIISSNLLQNKNTILSGYLELDKLRESSFYTRCKDNIVITASSILWKEIKMGVYQDNSWIYDLVQNFQSHNILFRPHPGESKHSLVREFLKEFNNCDNFVFDQSLSSINTYKDTSVFISDGLATATYTYAFATLKPIIFYIPNWKDYEEKFGKNHHINFLGFVGDVVTKHKDLEHKVHQYLKDDYYLQEKSKGIQKFRDSIMINIGTSQTHIKNFLEKYIDIERNDRIKNHYFDKLMHASQEKINSYFDSMKNKKIAIYGAGIHFEEVLQRIYNFNNLNIVCFSDSNTKIIGEKKQNKPIVDKTFLGEMDIILISSKKYEVEIKEDLKKLYNHIYTIYEHIGFEIELLLNLDPWKNLNLMESKLSKEQINEVLALGVNDYRALFEKCKEMLEKDSKTVFYSSDNNDIYMNKQLFLYHIEDNR